MTPDPLMDRLPAPTSAEWQDGWQGVMSLSGRRALVRPSRQFPGSYEVCLDGSGRIRLLSASEMSEAEPWMKRKKNRFGSVVVIADAPPAVTR